MKLRLARHQKRLTVTHPILIEELLELEAGGHQVGVSTMISMLADLHRHGRDSRYLEKLNGFPACELKPTARGGEAGGSRVYLFLLENGEAGIVNCEIKDGTTTSKQKLSTVLQVIQAYKNGVPVFEDP